MEDPGDFVIEADAHFDPPPDGWEWVVFRIADDGERDDPEATSSGGGNG